MLNLNMSNILLYHFMGKFGRQQTDDIFLIIPWKQALTFHANCLLKETIFIKCQSLFSRKNKQKYFKMLSAKIFTQNAKC